MFKKLALVLSLVSSIFVVSCAGDIQNSGSIVYEENIFSLQNQASTKQDVLTLIGPPSYRSAYNQDVWYYIHEKTSQLAFFHKKLIERNIYVVTFEGNNLKNIDYLNKQDGNNVAFYEKRTRFAGAKRTLLEKVFTGTQYGM